METPEFAAFCSRIVRRHGVRVGIDGDEPDLARLVELREEVEAAIQSAVDGMRARGLSWQYIADGLGTNRSSAHERYGRPAAPHLHSVPAPQAGDRSA